MNRKDRFNSNLEKIKNKFNNNIQLVDQSIEYIKRIEISNWICKKHNIVFETTLDILLNKNTTCICPVCRNNKLLEASIKGVQRRKELKGIDF